MPTSDSPDYGSPRWQVALALSDAQQQAARIAGAAFQGLAAAFSNFPTRRSPR